MFRKLFLIYKDLSKQMSKQNISAFAASSAFFVFLSLIPMLIMICTIIPFTPLTEENLLTAFTEYTPNVFNPLIRGVISQVYEKSAGILSLAESAHPQVSTPYRWTLRCRRAKIVAVAC